MKIKEFFAKHFKSNTLKLFYADSVKFNAKTRQFKFVFNDIPFYSSRWIKRVELYNSCKKRFYCRDFDFPVFFRKDDTLTLTIVISWDGGKKVKGKHEWVGKNSFGD